MAFVDEDEIVPFECLHWNGLWPTLASRQFRDCENLDRLEWKRLCVLVEHSRRDATALKLAEMLNRETVIRCEQQSLVWFLK